MMATLQAGVSDAPRSSRQVLTRHAVDVRSVVDLELVGRISKRCDYKSQRFEILPSSCRYMNRTRHAVEDR